MNSCELKQISVWFCKRKACLLLLYLQYIYIYKSNEWASNHVRANYSAGWY